MNWNFLRKNKGSRPQRPSLVIDVEGEQFITADPSWQEVARGIICAGCVGAFEAALAERTARSGG
jgi:hypothetical protein